MPPWFDCLGMAPEPVNTDANVEEPASAEAPPTDAARTTGPALEAHYRFLLWLVPAVERFPRSQKFLLGDRMQRTALDQLSCPTAFIGHPSPAAGPSIVAWSKTHGIPLLDSRLKTSGMTGADH